MEGRVWAMVLTLVPRSSGELGRFVYDQRLILCVLLWAVLHDRPQAWACDPAHWPDALRPRHLPDPSTLSRRKRRDDTPALLRAVQDKIRQALGPPTRDADLDSRPLVVGGASKDPTARAGRGVGGFARGYRAHMLADRLKVIRALEVRPMSVSDKVVARPLLAHAPRPIQRVFADANYDSVALQDIAQRTGKRLYTGVRQGRVGRRQDPRRVRLLALSKTPAGQRAMDKRDSIERVFALMSNLAFGLKSPPPWVRGMDRVSFWVEAKVLFYHAYLAITRGLAPNS